MLAHAGAPWYLRHRYMLAAAGGTVLIVTAFAMGRTSSRVTAVEPPGGLTALLPPVAPPPPLAPASVETIVLSVAVSPANAHVLIDGQLLPSNPFLTRYPRNTATHRLRAVAPGFEPKERWVTFSDNVVLDISLIPIQVLGSSSVRGRDRDRDREREHVRGRESSAARKPPSPAPAAIVPPAAAHIEIPPSPIDEKSRRHRIEAADPYAKDQ